MSEFDALMGCIGFFFIGLTIGYRRGWIDALKKLEDKEWASK